MTAPNSLRPRSKFRPPASSPFSTIGASSSIVHALTNARGGATATVFAAGWASRIGFSAVRSAGDSIATASPLMSLRNPRKLLPPLYPPALTNQVKYSLRSSGVHPTRATRSAWTYASCSSCVGASASSFIVFATTSGSSRKTRSWQISASR